MIRAVVRFTAFSAFVLVCTHCKEATQAKIVIRTNVPCDRIVGTAIAAGKPGSTESAIPAVTTGECFKGFVGSLVLVPETEKTAKISVRVTMALDTGIENCTRQNKYAGCIVARRLVRYVAGVPITLPINMYLACKDVPCNETSTCSIAGQCISAELAGEACTSEEGCLLPGDVDLGGSDDPSFDGSVGADGGSSDGSAQDAMRDGQTRGDGGQGVSGVACNTSTTVSLCSAGNVCCTSISPQDCRLAVDCEGASFACDQPQDCSGGVCCLYLLDGMTSTAPYSTCETGTTCPPVVSRTSHVMCRTASDCATGKPHCDYRTLYGSCETEAELQGGVVCPDAYPVSRCGPGQQCCLRIGDEYPRGACVGAGQSCNSAEFERFACDDSNDCATGGACVYSPGQGSRCALAAPSQLCNRDTDCTSGACEFGAVLDLYGRCRQ